MNGLSAEEEAPVTRNTEDAPSRSDPPAAEGQGKPAKEKVFLQLFLQNERRLLAYILTLLPNRADADDVLQEASLVMWDKFDVERPPDDFTAWGCRIAYYKVLDFYKKSQRCKVRFSQAMLEQVAATAVEQAGALQLDDRRQALSGCVDKLEPRDQDLLSRRFAAGATTQSTAAQVGRSVDAVYKALAKIRQALFDCVSRSLAQGGR
jgi:RNA polymerase sigma-70 factor (ECF subfamily)